MKNCNLFVAKSANSYTHVNKINSIVEIGDKNRIKECFLVEEKSFELQHLYGHH